MFRRIGDWFRNFMLGRYGSDKLNVALLIAGVVLMALGSLFGKKLAFLSLVAYVPLFYCIFRMYSRNLTKRRAENQRFLNWWLPKRNAWNAAKSRRKDKDHAYFACKTCGTWCRVPKGKGSIELTCPKCRSTMRVKS